jgi:DNA-directed RNA polymerase alpha subunit
MEASLQITKEKQMEIRNLAREHEYITSQKPPYMKWEKNQTPDQCEAWLENYEANERYQRLLKGQMLYEMGERVRNVLARQGIVTDYDLLRHTQDELLEFTNFGHGSLHEVIRVLDLHGYVMPLGDK